MDQIEIKGVPAKTEDVFFFTLSIELLPGETAECNSVEEAIGSPLFTELFKLPWVRKVASEGRALIVKKSSASPAWENCAPLVAAIIRGLYEKGIPFFSTEYIKTHAEKKNAQINPAVLSSPLGTRIQAILSSKVSPSLALHGGRVELVDIKEGEVYLYFGGGCQGCSQASVTVKEGIEKLLLQEFPEIKSVVDVTDHSKGKNPFYK